MQVYAKRIMEDAVIHVYQLKIVKWSVGVQEDWYSTAIRKHALVCSDRS